MNQHGFDLLSVFESGRFPVEGALSGSRLFTNRWYMCRLRGYAAVIWGFHAFKQANQKVIDATIRLLNNSLCAGMTGFPL